MITKRSKYALKALLALARTFDSRQPVLISELSRRERIPKKFLELILLDLRNKGLLASKKGKGGGYFLARLPSHIHLGEVMRLTEGPLAPLPCLSKTAYRKCEECAEESSCAIRLVMKEIYEDHLRVLEATSLEDMLAKAEGEPPAPMYAI